MNKATLLFPAEMVNHDFYLFNSQGQMIDKIKVSGRLENIDLSDKCAGVFFLINQKLETVIKINKIEIN